MAGFTAADVKALREKTGAGMMDAKKALEQTGGDIEAAVDALRAKGLALVQMTSLTFTFFNTFVNPIALDAIQWKYYFVFLAVLVAMVFSVWFKYPETRGLTLENVAWLFDGEQANVGLVSAKKVLEDEKRTDHVEVRSA